MEPTAAASTLGQTPPAIPAGDAQSAELARLTERLRVSDEWNVRLQGQIQELLRLPQNEVRALQERMQNPDVAVPLLQCYDAAILEKAEENTALREENARLRTGAEVRTAEHADLTNAVRIAEDLAKHVQAKSTEETQRAQSALKELQAECGQIRQELTRALDAEAESKRDVERLQTQLAAAKAELAAAQVEQARLGDALRTASDHRRQFEGAAGERRTQHEAQRVQLTLLGQENEERLAELERLRTRMVQALRQAADNHAAHMRVVEERHALVVRELQEAARTQELEVRKLRAQLARADPSVFPGADGGSSSSSRRVSTTQLLEAQTRLALEAEVKRLYNDVGLLQTQRDDAVLRYEQLTSNLRRDREQQQHELRQSVAAAAQERQESALQTQRLEAELLRARKAVDRYKTASQAAQEMARKLEDERDVTARELAEAKRNGATLASRLSAAAERAEQAEAAATARSSALENRVTAMFTEAQDATKRAREDGARAEEERDECRRQLARLQEKLAAATQSIADGERALQAQETQTRRLSEAVEMHRKKLVGCDERLLSTQSQLEAALRRCSECTLAVERLKIDNVRLTRLRERAG